MSKNVEEFFDIINKKTWKNNISNEAENLFDSLLEELRENKNDIIQYIIEDIERIEKIKTEDNEDFEYSTFKKWLNKYVREYIQDYLEDE